MYRRRASRPSDASNVVSAPGQSKSGRGESQSETVAIRALGNDYERPAGAPPLDATPQYERPAGAPPLDATPHVETATEHVRNALAIISALEYVTGDGHLDAHELVAGFAGISKRLNAALEQLEPRGDRK